MIALSPKALREEARNLVRSNLRLLERINTAFDEEKEPSPPEKEPPDDDQPKSVLRRYPSEPF